MKPKKAWFRKFIIKPTVALLVFGGIFWMGYRSCTRGYDQYGIYVHAEAKTLFQKPILPADPRIIERGRKPIKDIRIMDQDVDQGDGPLSGRLRWYACQGIDCEEGWENGFLPLK